MTGENPPVFQLFKIWFRLHHKEIFDFNEKEENAYHMVADFADTENRALFLQEVLPEIIAFHKR